MASWDIVSKLAVGTRVRFTTSWDIFSEDTLIREGLTGVVKQNTYGQPFFVLPDDESIRAKLAAWDGCIQLWPLDGDMTSEAPIEVVP